MATKLDAKIELIRVKLCHEWDRVQALSHDTSLTAATRSNHTLFAAGVQRAIKILDEVDERVR